MPFKFVLNLQIAINGIDAVVVPSTGICKAQRATGFYSLSVSAIHDIMSRRYDDITYTELAHTDIAAECLNGFAGIRTPSITFTDVFSEYIFIAPAAQTGTVKSPIVAVKVRWIRIN